MRGLGIDETRMRKDSIIKRARLGRAIATIKLFDVAKKIVERKPEKVNERNDVARLWFVYATFPVVHRLLTCAYTLCKLRL